MKTIFRGLLLLLTVPLFAQKPTPIELGFKAERVYDFSGIDNVNVFNGNNIITIPIGMRYPLTSNFSYGLTLIYNSKVWDHRNMQYWGDPGVDYWWARPNIRSNAGTGWRVSLGRLLPPTGPTTEYPSDSRTAWVYEGPSGDEHAFSSVPFSSATTEDPSATVQFTREEPFLRMVWTGSGSTTRTIEFPDGQVHTFVYEQNAWRLKRIADRFENRVDIGYTYSSGRAIRWTITDTANRTHYVDFEYIAALADSVDKGMNVRKIRLEPFSSTAEEYVYDFVYDTAFQTPFSCYHDYFDPPFPGAPTTNSTTLPVLQRLDLPDGTSYSFDYQNTSDGCGSGLIRALTLPTLGVISYTYQLYTLTDGACVPTGPRNAAPGIATRTIDGAVTKYLLTRGPNVTPVHPPNPQPSNCGIGPDGPITPNESRRWHRTSILSPVDDAGNRTRSDHYFNMWTAAGGDDDPALYAHDGNFYDFGEPMTAGWPGFQNAKLAPPFMSPAPDISALDTGTVPLATNRSLASQTWSGCAADGSCATLLRSTYRRLVRAEPGPRLTVSERTLMHDDSGCSGVTCYVQSDQDLTTWDRVGHFRTSTRSSNYPGTNGDSTTTNYASWSDSAARTTTLPWVLGRYTETSRTVGGITHRATHCFDSNGRLTRQRLLAGSTEQPTDLLTEYGWDGGNVVTEQSYGGDGGGLGVQTNLCTATVPAAGYENHYTWANGVLATSQYAPAITFFSLAYESDKTGLITTSRGPDGFSTTYDYETWGRLRSITPPGETPTTYTYANATATTTARVVASRDAELLSTVDDVISTYDYDGLGRVRRVERTLPGANCVEQEVSYDALGRKSSESIWKACGVTTTKKTSFRYDALGRLVRVTAPDATENNTAYIGSRIGRRTADAGGFLALTEEEYDIFGRLIRVTEDVNGPAPVTTDYKYDVGDRLTKVTIHGTDGDQTRDFTYDGRGLLISEIHPEHGSLGYPSTTYQYDSRGHVTSQAGALNLTYRYDKAERLTQIEETGVRLLEEYLFDEYRVPGEPSIPKPGVLTATGRYHYDSSLTSAPRIDVYQSFHYLGETGRLGSVYTTIGALNGIPGTTFFSTRTYDLLGQLKTIGYPCPIENCDRTKTISNQYKYGTLSAVSGWASAITYHPSGTIETVKHGSGSSAILESWTPDGNGMARPSAIQATNSTGTTTLWSSGTYTYDGSGNITNIGPTRYAYDGFQRLTGWTTASIGSTTSTYIHYDSYGNPSYRQTEGCGTGPNGPICFSPIFQPRSMVGTTNHDAEYTYNAAGSVTSDGNRTFTYDALNQVTRMNANERDYRFLYAAGGERVLIVERTPTRNLGTFTMRGFDNKLLSVFRSDITGRPVWSEDVIWRENTLLGQETAATGARHYTVDHLGSPRLITTAGGVPVGTQSFDPFGEGGSTDGGPLQFTAHERDGALFAGGAAILPDYMHARYYDSATGRFLSVDPGRDWDPHQPQSWNMYAYVQNNPINRVDPTGKACADLNLIGPCRPTAEATLAPPRNGANWTAEQKAAENVKNAQRAQLAEEGKLVVTRGQARPTSAQVAAVNGGSAPAGSHLDHTQEVVLGGAPLAKENIAPLDATVNTSNGARVRNAIVNLAEGTAITKFNYTVLNVGGIYQTLRTAYSYNTFMQNQENAHAGYVNSGDMLVWVFTGDTRASPPPCGTPGGGYC
ncbi:MAG TPA: RHS repeat-associated core domain-containing protein [Thermoanaerobaculia bacterium]|nr:RHS repeat-associated core domain-containing protein [Thermoanaerobaculia bacterium]